ncbi:MAG: hypothetical protein AMXMBFR33_30630 [Candidatus Xenobia bacterium]
MRPRLLVLLVVAMAWGGAEYYRFQHPLAQTARLRAVVSELETLQVTVFRDQDWCECFEYPGGRFMQSSHESTCGLFQGKARPFDQVARRDFERIATAVGKSRVSVLWITARYRNRKLVEAQFSLGGWGRRSFIYAPGYGTPPPDQGNEMRYTALDADWYQLDEDWN